MSKLIQQRKTPNGSKIYSLTRDGERTFEIGAIAHGYVAIDVGGESQMLSHDEFRELAHAILAEIGE